MALGSNSGPDIIMATGGSVAHPELHGPSSGRALRYQHGLIRWARPQASSWPLVVTATKDINSDPGYNRAMDTLCYLTFLCILSLMSRLNKINKKIKLFDLVVVAY